MRHDVKRELREFYRPRVGDFVEVDVPPISVLAIDGSGDPNTSSAYAESVAALYTVGYAVRAALREATGDDFVVGPLEGMWTAEDPTAFARRAKGEWSWTMLIPLPGVVGADVVAAGMARAAARKPGLPIGGVQRRELHEGRCLQMLHLGSYDDEGPTLARLHEEVMPALGVTWNGPHHEIYLSDPRRVPPERLRTILRQPVRDVARG